MWKAWAIHTNECYRGISSSYSNIASQSLNVKTNLWCLGYMYIMLPCKNANNAIALIQILRHKPKGRASGFVAPAIPWVFQKQKGRYKQGSAVRAFRTWWASHPAHRSRPKMILTGSGMCCHWSFDWVSTDPVIDMKTLVGAEARPDKRMQPKKTAFVLMKKFDIGSGSLGPSTAVDKKTFDNVMK